MKSRSPSFQFYPADWLADLHVRLMSPCSRGIYITLLSYCWLEESLPSDIVSLQRLVGCSEQEWAAHGAVAVDRFTLVDGRLHNQRLDKERKKQDDFHRQSRKGGRASAASRKASLGSSNPRTNAGTKREPSCEPGCEPTPEPIVNSSSSSSSSSPSTERKKNKNMSGTPDGFDAFWNVYPRKKARKDAEKAYRVLAPDEIRLTMMIGAILRQKDSRQWKQGIIPLPATWIRGERWNDEPDTGLPFAAVPHTQTVAAPAPAYDSDWCQHEPRCNSRDWHAVLLERESKAAAL
jgi:uncharacterized protein YdaU (DUF1376 family)